MAAALPDLHAAYEAMYRALTLDDHHLRPNATAVTRPAILAADDTEGGEAPDRRKAAR